MIEELMKYDQELFLFLNNLGTEDWDWFWLIMTGKYTQTPLYAFLLYLIYRNLGWKGTLVTVVLVAGMITCTDQLANLFKDSFQRLRPCNEDFVAQIRLLVGCGKYGFFSAHAASSFALAFYVGLILKPYYKYIFPAMLFWAMLVSYSRIYVGVHYPGDTIVGIFMGTVIGLVFYKLYQLAIKKFVGSKALDDNRKH